MNYHYKAVKIDFEGSEIDEKGAFRSYDNSHNFIHGVVFDRDGFRWLRSQHRHYKFKGRHVK